MKGYTLLVTLITLMANPLTFPLEHPLLLRVISLDMLL